jgi:hypothetical protein
VTFGAAVAARWPDTLSATTLTDRDRPLGG